MKEPAISVIMAVYNGEEYLHETMNSIICQTFDDWELVVVDDCSKDSTPAILEEYAGRDSRIRILKNAENKRLQYSLNRAVSEARGKYMLRIDADDVCRADRFEKQFKFMGKHPELAMSACKFFLYIDGKIVPGPMTQRSDKDAVSALLLFFNPICHPCVIMKSDIAKEMMYDEHFTCSEDLELWTRMVSQNHRIALQKERLVLYRRHPGQITANSFEKQCEQYKIIIERFYEYNLLRMTKEQIEFQTNGVYFRDKADVQKLSEWLYAVRSANKNEKRFKASAVNYAAFELLMEYKRKGFDVTKEFLKLGIPFLCRELPARAVRRIENRLSRSKAISMFKVEKT